MTHDQIKEWEKETGGPERIVTRSKVKDHQREVEGHQNAVGGHQNVARDRQIEGVGTGVEVATVMWNGLVEEAEGEIRDEMNEIEAIGIIGMVEGQTIGVELMIGTEVRIVTGRKEKKSASVMRRMLRTGTLELSRFVVSFTLTF